MDDRHGLVAHIRPARRVAQINPLVDQLPQSQMLGQARRGDQPGVGHQPLVVEGHLDAVQTVRDVRIRKVPPVLG